MGIPGKWLWWGAALLWAAACEQPPERGTPDPHPGGVIVPGAIDPTSPEQAPAPSHQHSPSTGVGQVSEGGSASAAQRAFAANPGRAQYLGNPHDPHTRPPYEGFWVNVLERQRRDVRRPVGWSGLAQEPQGR